MLAITMIVAFFAGCTSNEAADTTPSESAKPAAAEVSAPTETSVIPSVAVESNYTSPGGISYPISDGSEELSFFVDAPPIMMGVASWSELPGAKSILDATGINYKYIEVASTIKTEQFNLMIASGDYTDLIDVSSYAGGGASQAYADGVIIDVADLSEQYAPDFWLAANETNDATVRSLKSSGQMYGIYKLLKQSTADGGPFYRKDWQEALGISTPHTLDEFTDMLYAFKDKYDCDHTYYVGTSGVLASLVNAAFGCIPLNLTGTDLGLYLDDNGKVTNGITSDGYREYLEWFYKLYSDDIIYKEFYASSDPLSTMYSIIGTGNAGVWNDSAGGIDQTILSADENNKNMVVGGISGLYNDEGVFDFQSIEVLTDGCWSISTCCENPALALEFANYFYTEPGMKLSNYGVEGISYTVDADGEIQFTQQVYDDISAGLFNYTPMFMPYLKDPAFRWMLFTDMQLDALWAVRNRDIETSTKHSFSVTNLLTADESASISSKVTDIVSYASEAALKFMTGDVEINDTTWAEFVSSCNGLNLPECVEVYQKAYDDYVAGNR